MHLDERLSQQMGLSYQPTISSRLSAWSFYIVIIPIIFNFVKHVEIYDLVCASSEIAYNENM